MAAERRRQRGEADADTAGSCHNAEAGRYQEANDTVVLNRGICVHSSHMLILVWFVQGTSDHIWTNGPKCMRDELQPASASNAA